MLKRQEFVPPLVYTTLIKRGLDPIFLLMDNRIIEAYKRLKTKFPDLYVNNWHHDNGTLSQCGFRDSVSTGAVFSQHRYGRALDLHTTVTELAAVREEILKNWKDYPEITTMEDPQDTPGWIHIDCRFQLDSSKIHIVRGK